MLSRFAFTVAFTFASIVCKVNAKLLQKIEELTLYIIQENQSRKEQQKLIQKQAELIEKLQERVELLEN